MPIRSSTKAVRFAGRITEKAITGLGRMRAKYAPATSKTGKTGKARHVPLSAAIQPLVQ